MSDESAWKRAIKKLAGKSQPVEGTHSKLTPKDRSQALKRVLKLSDPILKIRSIASIAADLGQLERRKDRSAVICEALDKLAASEEIDIFAASAIVSARNYLEPAHQVKLRKVARRRPEIVEALNSEINARGASADAKKFLEDALRHENNPRVELMRSVRVTNDRGRKLGR